ncbi:hypothetical protein [Rhizobium grahamii]|uniref:Uncharacterized protein n=1 Tax=Rhizobium grahamii CCGE 502 TaxID=990285 RepID=S3H8Y4_9HYPH|nr:hypothetical protein [Rhizobium grahamii]EPE95352.1 hypothetical protein RGCCGE502_25738 [Rhizobium grahamii CCGE 502]
MKTTLVPHDIYMKHEIEWQALRAAADIQIDLERIEITNSLGSRWEPATRLKPDTASAVARL